MIVGPLKNNIQISIIILLLLCMGIWASTFGFISQTNTHINNNEHILYFYFFNNLPFIAGQILTLVVILLGAFLVNFLSIEQEITSKTNYLPAFFYLLFAFSANGKSIFEPILIANLFVLLALYFLINSYRKDFALTEFYKAGLFMGLASFFCIHYILVFPLSFIALIILRPFNWREWSVLFLGLITPLYIYICLSYLTTNSSFKVFDMMRESIATMQKPIISEYYLAFILISVLAFVLAFMRYLSYGFGGKVKTQKTKYILLWMVLFCLIMMFFEQTSDMILLPCIIPLSIIIGDYVAEIKKLKIANTWLVLFVASFLIIYFHALGVI